MILLLGASGYIGEAFAKELQRRKKEFIPLARKQVDYTRFDRLLDFLKVKKPSFVINAAGYTGKPNVDACELDKAGTLAGNLCNASRLHALMCVMTPNNYSTDHPSVYQDNPFYHVSPFTETISDRNRPQVNPENASRPQCQLTEPPKARERG